MLKRTLEPEVMDTDQEADEYDAMDHSEVNARFVANLLAAGDTGCDILDIGTGTARIAIELCCTSDNDDLRVMACDLSVAMLELARVNIELESMIDRIQLEHVDAKDTPFEDEMFSTVLSNSIIHHIPEPLAVLKEADRVLAAGGLMFFRDLSRPNTEDDVEQLVATYACEETESAQQLFRQSLHAALTVDEMRELVEHIGYDPQTVEATSDRHWTWQARKENSSQ